MLERTSVVINDKEMRIVGMPAAGRKILGKAAAHTHYKWLTKDSRSSHHVSKY